MVKFVLTVTGILFLVACSSTEKTEELETPPTEIAEIDSNRLRDHVSGGGAAIENTVSQNSTTQDTLAINNNSHQEETVGQITSPETSEPVSTNILDVSVEMIRQDLEEYVASREFQSLLYQQGIYLDQEVMKIQLDCDSRYFVKPSSFKVMEPMTFSDASFHPMQGVVSIRYDFNRCNQTKIYNTLVIAENGEQPKLMFTIPGVTNASPQLLKNMYAQAIPQVVEKQAGSCQQAVVTDTRVTQNPSPVQIDDRVFQGVWEEQWQIKACDKDFETTFCFIPDGNEGTYWSNSSCQS